MFSGKDELVLCPSMAGSVEMQSASVATIAQSVAHNLGLVSRRSVPTAEIRVQSPVKRPVEASVLV